MQPASAASADLALIKPSPAISSARVRAGVMRGGHAGPFDEAHAEARRRRVEGGLGAHHHAHDHAERRQRVLRDPFGEPQGRERQRRHIEALGHGLELLGVDGTRLRAAPLRRAGIPDDADTALRTERHDHKRARREIETLGHEIVVGLVERDRQQHGHERPRLSRAIYVNAEKAIQMGAPARLEAWNASDLSHNLGANLGRAEGRRKTAPFPYRQGKVQPRDRTEA